VIQTSTWVTARAFQSGYTPSPISSSTFTIAVADPAATPGAGTYDAETQTIAVNTVTPGAEIHYTINGADPTTTDPIVPANGQIAMSGFTLKVRAFKTGCAPSAVVVANYVMSGTTTTAALSGGWTYSLALKRDGTVWAWGDNQFAEIGDGTHTRRLLPTLVPTLTNVKQIAGAAADGLALLNDGSIRAWGENNDGRLGDGSNTQRPSPVTVTGITDAVAIEAAPTQSAAVKADGTLLMWGSNSNGQLGNSTTTGRNTPGPVSGLTNVTAIGLGALHSLAVRADGTVWAWGYNNNGQLGDGSTLQRTTPVQVIGLTNISRVQGGYYFSAALGTDGAVRTWGANTNGQLGDGTTTPRSTAAVSGLSNVVQIAAGLYHWSRSAPTGPSGHGDATPKARSATARRPSATRRRRCWA
jgi:hypothetical protein